MAFIDSSIRVADGGRVSPPAAVGDVVARNAHESASSRVCQGDLVRGAGGLARFRASFRQSTREAVGAPVARLAPAFIAPKPIAVLVEIAERSGLTGQRL